MRSKVASNPEKVKPQCLFQDGTIPGPTKTTTGVRFPFFHREAVRLHSSTKIDGSLYRSCLALHQSRKGIT